MSLTSHLRNGTSPLRTFLGEHFPGLKAVTADARARLRALGSPATPVEHREYGRVGTAIDYRLRYYFAVTPVRKLAAARGAWMLYPQAMQDLWLPGVIEPPAPHKGKPRRERAGTKAAREFFSAIERVPTIMNPVGLRLSDDDDRLLARYCYGLALYEEGYRCGFSTALAGLGREAGLDEVLNLAPDAVVDDLCGLSRGFYETSSNLFGVHCELNPSFDGSGHVGGADADFVLDGTLIEVKTTLRPEEKLADVVRQLLGYALLDYSDRYGIRGIGIYFTRQQCLVTWPIAEALTVLTGVPTDSLGPFREQLAPIIDQGAISREPETPTA